MRLVDADKMMVDFAGIVNEEKFAFMTVSQVMEMIDAQPTVEQKYGHWIVIEQDVTGLKRYECSECGKTDDDYSEPIFCKHCCWANGRTGKMDEVTEDDESPIKIFQDKIATDFARKIDKETGKAIYEATQRLEIAVDDNELLKALRFDRGQYDKGYDDGFNDGRKAVIAEIIEKYGDEVTE